ncbi:unnamed protein product, partial [Laminaria digitata]
VALRRRTGDTQEHHDKILEQAVEESRALKARLDRANQLREASERKVASLARRLAQVQAEASVVALEAERAEELADGVGGGERGLRSRGRLEFKARLEDQLAAMEEAVLSADRLAEQQAELAVALEEKVRSLER